jgi:hypothetical protein
VAPDTNKTRGMELFMSVGSFLYEGGRGCRIRATS